MANMDRNEPVGGVALGRGVCDAETARAIHVVLDGGDPKGLWIPSSVVHEDSEVFTRGATGSIVVAAWWAEENKLASARRAAPLLVLKPPTKKWLRDQADRMARAKRARETER